MSIHERGAKDVCLNAGLPPCLRVSVVGYATFSATNGRSMAFTLSSSRLSWK
jgi:hypothetical protein